jgi:asparagine synthase (glutamine-hydrolysing)
MCGIVGFCGASLPDDEAAGLLRRMCATIAHRGPDGQGVHAGEGVGLGHRRLSIIDLSSNAAQPMATADGHVRIVYNGEIFNHIELRAMLVARGRRFATSSDTEVILQLYEEMGPDFVSLLNGDFAFAIWDGRRKRMLLARDRMGVRPLLYTWRGGAL